MTRSKLFSARPLRVVAAALVVAVAGGLAVNAIAQPHRGPGGYGGPMMMMGNPHHLESLLKTLHATDAQRAQITSILAAARTDLRAQHEAGRALQQKMMDVFTAPNVDAGAAESLREQMLTQHDQASRRMLQTMLDVSNVLTPEQRQQFGQMMAERRAKMEQWRAAHPRAAAPVK
ncbi:MAG: hypothetical protein ABT20_09340 [Rubrivivax sp. SCN 70-15]|nr:MAG: hypothetical protein ABT20_09340 [Rubrivivax sp. SCN 70-15]